MKRVLARRDGFRRRGATVAFVAISLFTLFACASLAIDVGYICALTAEAQNTADAGALAGANLLQEKQYGDFMERVLRIIAMNQKPQGFLSLEDQRIEVGIWDSVNQTFTPLPPEEWAERAFAVRVRAARNGVNLFFAPIAGHRQTDVWRDAVAVGSRPCKGIWGLNGVRVVGNVETDSYVGEDGEYDSLTANSNGDLCSNRAIDINGSVTVNGDTMAGFGYPVTVKGSGTVTGLTTSNVYGVTPPPVDFGDASFTNDNLSIGLTDGGRVAWSAPWDFRIAAGDSITISEGTYFLNSMRVHSTATVRFDGPVTLFVTGDIDATGAALINESQDASNLTIIGSGTNISLGGTEDLYASVYVPNSTVNLFGDAGFYGALIGETVTMNGNFQVHVDESLPLADLFDPPPPFLVE